MNRRWRFVLPPAGRRHPAWGIASAVAHVVVIALLVLYSGPSFTRRTVTMIELGPGGAEPRQVDLTLPVARTRAEPVPPPAGPAAPARPDTTPLRPREVALVPPREVPRGIPEPAEPGGVAAAERDGARPAEDSAATPSPSGRLLGPRLGDGRLWVRPEDAIMAAIAGALDEAAPDSAEHLERLEEAVAARILAFLDTLPRDSMSVAPTPDWTTEINGQTWGIDREWIHLGALKLPTMILALLPLPQGNYDQSQRAAELQRIRDDILQAARRAETADQFRRYVEETRARRDAERERNRNRGVVPKDSVRT